ncbi:hypothetical protein QOZ80_4BG0329480 [Eleusine coracana subsp. coracana]|nr:hypothetical protein QOZ80_4BG0329480 [Eleusine coracana subsp. coracana]
METMSMEELLRKKASLLRDFIQKSQNINRDVAAALTSISGHMAAIDDMVLPAQARAYDASRVHDNVRRSLGTVGTMVSQLHFLQEAERVILSRPRKGLSAYLDAVDKLRSLAQKSVQLGCPQHFQKIYREVRGSTLELNLKYMGVEYVTTEEMQNTHAGSLGAKIADWIQYYQIAIKLFFAAERKLCDQIFEGKHTMKDNCFAEVMAKSLSTLLSFGEAVAKSQASLEILFMLLDMYEATFELQSEVEVVFRGYACSIHRKSALNLIWCLALTAKRTFNDFKESILKDSPNSTTTDGDVHPLTSYVINYIKFLFESICSSKVKDLFGDDWVQRRQRIVQQHAVQYRRVSWGKKFSETLRASNWKQP